MLWFSNNEIINRSPVYPQFVSYYLKHWVPRAQDKVSSSPYFRVFICNSTLQSPIPNRQLSVLCVEKNPVLSDNLTSNIFIIYCSFKFNFLFVCYFDIEKEIFSQCI